MPKFQRKTKSERMEEIQRAAKEVFLKKGFRYTTMEDIVAHTSLSKGGVYQYYKNTKSILFDIMQNGNYFRLERTEELIQGLASHESPAEIMTQACMAKLFDEVPEKKLYLMFLAEILYDKSYESLYFELEKQAFDLFIKNLRLSPEKEKKVSAFITSQVYFIARIFNGALVMHELFSDKNVFIQNKQKIHDVILTIMQTALGADTETI